jgi:uncharacterized protein (TIGR00255 family)
MTGYSRVEAEEAGLSVSVTLRSINHRFLDVQVHLPPGLVSLEPQLRRLLKEYVTRGHVEVTVSLERRGPTELQLDRNLLAAYVGAYRSLRQEFGSASEPDLLALLRIPGMVVADASSDELGITEKVVERVAAEALQLLNDMRAQEGKTLERDMLARLARLESLGRAIGQLSEGVPQLYQQRLANRVRELLGSVEQDGARLAQEVAYFASRSDITEELTRLRSHLEQAKRLVEESSEVGKKLDFLLQEMNREANTLLSKTTDVPDVGLEIARQAIEVKTEIEKLREQAQNIE